MPNLTTSDGARIAYFVSRQNPIKDVSPPIVFIHGWCSRARHFDPQRNHFRRRHSVLAVDRRGHGRSEHTDSGYEASRHACDLQEVMDAEQISNPVLVAHAGGVPTALELAARSPEYARALVLIDSRLGPAADTEDPDDPAGIAYRGMIDAIRGPAGAEAFREMYAPLFSPHAGERGEQALVDATSVPLEIAALELASLTIDTESLARKIDQPVLWITAGACDEGALRAAFSNIEFAQTVGSGHFPQLEVPDQINAMIRRFIATL